MPKATPARLLLGGALVLLLIWLLNGCTPYDYLVDHASSPARPYYRLNRPYFGKPYVQCDSPVPLPAPGTCE
jgi:hypothetical protein